MNTKQNEMKKTEPKPSKLKTRGVMIAATLLILAVSTITGLSFYKPSTTAAYRAESAPGAAVTPAAGDVNVTINDRGFDPESTVHAAGQFRLVVNNQSGVEGLTLKLNYERGGNISEMNIPAGSSSWSQELDLQPGTYILTEANHPAWLFHITVQ